VPRTSIRLFPHLLTQSSHWSAGLVIATLALSGCGSENSPFKELYEQSSAEDTTATASAPDENSSSDSDGNGGGGTADNSAAPMDDIDLMPVVRIGEDITVAEGSNATLRSTVLFQSLPTESAIVQWTTLSGPGAAVFIDTGARETEVSFDRAGNYVLQLTATIDEHTASDTVVVTVTPLINNQPPVVDAGRNAAITSDQTLMLEASVSDDGLPDGAFNSYWQLLSGPGSATFGEPSAATTSVTFDTAGTFLLEHTATDGELQTSDRMQVIVTHPPTGNDPTETAHTDNANAENPWEVVTSVDTSQPVARHEAGAVAYQNKFYLLGGRGKRAVNRYDTDTGQWENLGTPSREMHHFQPVVYDNRIYVIGALGCCFPHEPVIARIQIFDPTTRTWSEGASLPAKRRRGSSGVVVYSNKIYIVGGSTNGHDGGMVNWFDEYDPATDTWTTLPNAPTKRDHFNAVVVDNKLVAAGGRMTDFPDTFGNLVSSVDVYDFANSEWESVRRIPTQRAGAMVVAYGDEAIVIGGETRSAGAASAAVEAFNVKTRQWRTLQSLAQARHGGGAVVLGDELHVASGNVTQGGGNETRSHEKLNLK